MSISAFGEKSLPPSLPDIAATLGTARPLWERLDRFMGEAYGVEGALNYAGKSGGWIVWYRKSGRTLLALFPQAGALAAQVIIGPSRYEAALALDLRPETREALEQAHPYPDGRWLLLPVSDEATAADVERLVQTKTPPPKRRPRAAS